MNQVGLVGRITKDPVLRQLSDNKVQTSFSIAINRNFRNNQGTVDADFVLCVAWGNLAEHIVQYCGKGSLIGVNGRLQTRTYMNRENHKVYTTEVVVAEVRFYALKTRDNQHVPEINSSQPATTQDVSEHFVLPEREEQLPISQL